MTQENEAAKAVDVTSRQTRPDPMFKDVTRQAAREAGLELLNVELPQMLRADLVLATLGETDLSGTLFEFLQGYARTIIEFKSQNDDFDQYEFALNLSRSYLFYAQQKLASYSQLLTVFVCAERPDSVLDHLAEQGVTPQRDPARPWLLRYQVGFLEIAIVICRLLPLESKYYWWLLFAPAGSLKWREFVKMAIRNGDRALVKLLQQLKPKEFNVISLNIPEILKGLSEEERAEWEQDTLNLLSTELTMLEEMNPEGVSEVVSKLKPETLAAGLSLEQRLAGLEPEQRLAGLEPEQRLAGLKPEQRLAGLSAQERQKLLELLSQPNNPGEEGKA